MAGEDGLAGILCSGPEAPLGEDRRNASSLAGKRYGRRMICDALPGARTPCAYRYTIVALVAPAGSCTSRPMTAAAPASLLALTTSPNRHG
jgi:hypothetical protein